MRKYDLMNTEAGMRAETERLAKRKERDDEKKTVLSDGIDDEGGFFSHRKNVVRLILFVVALGLAIYFITHAVNLMIHKDPGWYEIECDADKEVPYFSSGFTFKYEFTGSSSEIGAKMKELKSVYTEALKSNFKLLGADVTYDDTVNIASINEFRGESVVVSEALFSVLKDAEQRSAKSDAYSLTAGVFNAIRDPIVYSDTPLDADPVFDPVCEEMLSKLESIMESPDAAVLTFNESETSVRLDISGELASFMKEYEIDCPVLDLGQLREAYILKNVASVLEERGYVNGYLTTDSGLSYLLPGMKETELAMYSRVDAENGVETVVSATVKAQGGFASASLRVFNRYDGEYGFYSFEKDGKVYRRNPYMSDFDGEDAAFAALAVSEKGDVVSASYEALRSLKDGVKQKLDFDSEEEIIPIVELADERGIIQSAGRDIELNEEAGFKLKQLYYK